MAKIKGHDCSSLGDVERSMRGKDVAIWRYVTEWLLSAAGKSPRSVGRKDGRTEGRMLPREDRSRDYVNATELQLSSF